MRSKKKKRALSGLLVAAMLTSMLNTTSVFSSSDYEEPQEASETVATTEAPAPETQAPTEETAPATEAQTQAAAEATEAPESDAAATEQTTDGQTGTEAEATEATTDTEKATEKETETEKEVRKNKVTFQVDDGALVTIKDIDITKDTKEAHEASQAIDGKIVFKVVAKDGYEITKVRVDDEADARKNEETKDEPDDYIIEGILTDNTVVKVEAKRIEKEVTVTYEAEDGGQVTNAKETINLGDEDVNFIGSTAQSGKDLLFTSWKDEDGEVVSNNAEFTPSVDEVTEDVTYTANFIEKDQVPAQDFEKTEDVNGLTVKVEAKKGIFPKDTTMTVDAVPEKDALAIAQKAADEDKEVTAAVGVNITFRDADGKEIEPINAQAVKVKISLNNPLEGENFSVIHQTDDGNVTKVADANADGASFEASAFSIYAVVGDNAAKVATYEFYDGDTVLSVSKHDSNGTILSETASEQNVKNGEKVYFPETPEKTDGRVFIGWAASETGDVIYQSSVSQITASVSKNNTTVKLYAQYRNARYVFFMEPTNSTYDGEYRVYRTVESTKTKENNTWTSVNVSDIPNFATDSEHSISGWYVGTETQAPDFTNEAVTSIAPTDGGNVYLYPKVEEGKYLTFSTGEDASYIAPQFVAANAVTIQPADPKRQGYTFAGWATRADAKQADFTFEKVLTQPTTIYALWTPAETTYRVVYWKQKITDSVNTTKKSYDYAGSETRTANTGTTVSPTNVDTRKQGTNSRGYYYDESYRGFTYSTSTSVTVAADGSSILNVYYNRDVITIKFYRVNDYKYDSSDSYWYSNSDPYNDRNLKTTLTGLYGQPITSWPSETYRSGSTNYSLAWYTDRARDYYGTYYGSKKIVTFLDAFLPPDDETYATTLNYYGFPRESTANITFYVEKKESDSASGTDLAIDGVNYANAMNVPTVEGGTWYFTNKFTGYTFYGYRGGNRGKIDTSKYVAANDSDENGHVNVPKSMQIFYKLIPYKFEYINNGNKAKSESVKYGSNLKDLAKYVPERPANIPGSYTFEGWYIDETFQQKFNFDETTMPANDLVVYAYWKAPEFTVRVHDTDESEVVMSKTVSYGGAVNRNDMPSVYRYNDESKTTSTIIDPTSNETQNITLNAGEVFIGWATKDENGKYVLYNFDEKLTERDLDLYPYYLDGNSYSVTYYDNTEENDTTQTVKDPKVYTKDDSSADIKSANTLNAPEGKVFLYWNTESDGTGDSYYPGDKVEVTDDINLYAIWGEGTQTTTLTYHSNYPTEGLETKSDTEVIHNIYCGDTEKDPETNLDNNSTVTLYTADNAGFSIKGYVLKGWATTEATADAGTVEYKVGEPVVVDIERSNDLHAVWEIDYVTVTVVKRVTGNMYAENQEFGFRYTSNGAGDEKNPTTDSFNLQKDSDKTFKVQKGSTLTVTETNSGVGYTTSYQIDSESAQMKSDTSVSIKDINGDKTIYFTNDKTVTAPTGIGLNSTTPLLLILSAILLFFASFFYVRRNRVEEL